MMSRWAQKRILITVKTYPVPAQRGIEVSCTAGITKGGDWIRLHPVPYRFLDGDKRFTKYQWVDASVTKSSDIRPESHKLDPDSIVLGPKLETDGGTWRQRKDLLLPLCSQSLCSLERARGSGGATLGLFRPKEIMRLRIEPDVGAWTTEQLAKLQRASLFGQAPATVLQKIPFRFRYEFRCDDAECRHVHALTCTDWEMSQAYRSFRRDYGNRWEAKLRYRFETWMIEKRDTHFYVGTMHGHQATWLIIGLFYPPK